MRIPYHNVITNQQDDFYFNDGLEKIVDMIVKDWKKNHTSPAILFAGNTGTGKTTIMTEIMTIVSLKTGIEFDVNDIFFVPSEFVNAVISTEKKQRALDEAIAGLMATEHSTLFQKQLLKMFMMCRKKQHFVYLCVPAPEKLRDYIFIQATSCMIYTYKRKTKLGNFLFFDKIAKEKLYREWKRTGLMKYEKYYMHRGTFSNKLYNIVPELEYENRKDKGILKVLGDEKSNMSKESIELQKLKLKVWQLQGKVGMTQKELLNHFQITGPTFRKWNKNDDFSKEIEFLSINKPQK